MTESQLRFFNMLALYPRLEHLWDQKTLSLKINLFEASLGVLSPAEKQLAAFFANVWLHQNKYNFDFVNAVALLDGDNLNIIFQWAKDPFWP
jgi:hypothetical protein